MLTVLAFIIVLGLLVFVHEFGHFITARKSGMKVYEFGFGYPPRAFGFYKDPKTKKIVWVWGKSKKSGLKETVGGDERVEEYPATLYSINWLPIGGFVKIKGESGEKQDEPDSFGYQKAWKKIVVLVAGVTMNFLLAAILFSTGFMVGLPVDVTGQQDDRAIIIEEPKVLVQMTEKKSPAEEAGIQFGDKILQINDNEIENSAQVPELIKEIGFNELSLTIEREGESKEVKLTPANLDSSGDPKIGVSLVEAGIVRYPWYIALYKGFVAAGVTLLNIFIIFYVVIKNLIIGNGMITDVSGPVGIAVMIGQSARLGISYLINITAMLSLSLAVINILPIPALDGGRIIFVLFEKIFRRPVPLKYEQIAHTIGFLLLMLLVIVVTGRDILGLIG
ncbi:MAG: RIP metalloprotease RseP [Candidatus Magasanikbacteria bacterium]|nr:RIP metalloprotease RseP [Candidatus Magasanikbacteria bacterium]